MRRLPRGAAADWAFDARVASVASHRVRRGLHERLAALMREAGTIPASECVELPLWQAAVFRHFLTSHNDRLTQGDLVVFHHALARLVAATTRAQPRGATRRTVSSDA